MSDPPEDEDWCAIGATGVYSASVGVWTPVHGRFASSASEDVSITALCLRSPAIVGSTDVLAGID
jgi:hypothetical protein